MADSRARHVLHATSLELDLPFLYSWEGTNDVGLAAAAGEMQFSHQRTVGCDVSAHFFARIRQWRIVFATPVNEKASVPAPSSLRLEVLP
jgi:hypothetical protein